MQYSKLAIIAASMATLASAQLSGIPTCALNPAISALGSTPCGTDIKCACSDKAFITTLTPLIQQSCTNPADLQKAITAAVNLCASVGVTLSIPGTQPTTSAVAPTTAPVKPTTSAAPAPVSSSAAPVVSSSAAAVVTSTAVVPVSTVVASTTLTTTVCPSASVTPSASSNATTVSVTAPSSTIAYANGAQVVGAQAMGFVGAAAAVVAFFAL